MKETEAVFAPLREKIVTAVEALESLLVGTRSQDFISSVGIS